MTSLPFELGLGLDFTLGLSFDDQATLAREAAELGYEQIWTPEGSGLDSFQLCATRWQASRAVLPEGLKTGISVSPVAYRTPIGFAISAGTLGAQTGGRFILGIGSGGIQNAAFRKAMGIRTNSTLAVMRDYLTTVRGLLAGEAMDYEGEALTVRGQRLGIDPPPATPVYLGALGPRMLDLGGELADGICLNWCTPAQIVEARERVDAGASRAGREPGSVPLVEYIRICVDDDPAVARRGLARAILRERERLAREAGVEAVRRETGLRQPEAIALYESEGYERFECWPPIYSEDPLSVCFEKRFAQPAQRASA